MNAPQIYIPSDELVNLAFTCMKKSGSYSEQRRGSKLLAAHAQTMREFLMDMIVFSGRAAKTTGEMHYRKLFSTSGEIHSVIAEKIIKRLGIKEVYLREITQKFHAELITFLTTHPAEYGWGTVFLEDGIIVVDTKEYKTQIKDVGPRTSVVSELPH